MKSDDNPMSLVEKMNQAPRCTAQSKRTGERCKGPAVHGWTVCRFHGAGGGHRSGQDHPTFKHGMRTRDWEQARKSISDLVRTERALAALIE